MMNARKPPVQNQMSGVTWDPVSATGYSFEDLQCCSISVHVHCCFKCAAG